MAEQGARVTVVEAERREHAGAPFEPWAHRTLGLMRTVTGDEHGAPVLSDGSVFEMGSGSQWTFEDGLAVFESAMAKVVYRFVAAVPETVSAEDESYPELALLKPSKGVLTSGRIKAIADARTEYLDAVHASLAAAAQDPATAFGAMDGVLGQRRTAARLLDGTQARLRDLTDAEWIAVKDTVDPESLGLALAENDAWTAKLTGSKEHVEKRIAAARAAGKRSLGEEEHLYELTGALRGLRGEAQVLAERVARQRSAAA